MPYAAHYFAMLVGQEFLVKHGIPLSELSHRSFSELRERLSQNSKQRIDRAVTSLTEALQKCYGDRKVSLQQLAATFRRGDLLEMLG